MLRVENVTKNYGSFQVLKSVSAEFPAGSISSIIGPNGAGKSTLLNIMGRLTVANDGSVYLAGSPLQNWNPRELAKELAILKQSNGTQMQLTVEDLVAFGRFPHSQGRLTKTDRERIETAIEFTGLSDSRKKYISQLSGGQRQRAYIAMVIAQDTKIILLDEPLNNLDMKHALAVMELLQRLSREKGKTIVTVMHDINIAAAFSSHLYAIKDGMIAFAGPSESCMNARCLSAIFGVPCRILNCRGQRICMYY